MQKSQEEVFALFRSLRPDDKHLQTPIPVAAHAAQQRWPILKAIAPKLPEATLPLTDEARAVWASEEKHADNGRKSVLTVPGLNDKLSKGLLKMSSRVQALGKPAAKDKHAEVLAAPALAIVPASKPIDRLPKSAAAQPAPVAVVASAAPRVLKNPLLPAILPVSAPTLAKPAAPVVAAKTGLFAKSPLVAPAMAPEPAAPSLAAVFARLAHKVPAQAAIPVKKASFFSRLGKK